MTDSVQEIYELDPSLYNECIATHDCVNCIEGWSEIMCNKIGNFFVSFPLIQFITQFNDLHNYYYY